VELDQKGNIAEFVFTLPSGTEEDVTGVQCNEVLAL